MDTNTAPKDTEVLPANECWRLLRTASIGRLSVIMEDHPDIFPVNYKVDHGTLVFRTGAGTKLAAMEETAQVAFEADGFADNGTVMWSVVIKGTSAQLQKTEDLLDSVSLDVFPWEAGRKDHFVRIIPVSVTGRRFTIEQPTTWATNEPNVRPAPDE